MRPRVADRGTNNSMHGTNNSTHTHARPLVPVGGSAHHTAAPVPARATVASNAAPLPPQGDSARSNAAPMPRQAHSAGSDAGSNAAPLPPQGHSAGSDAGSNAAPLPPQAHSAGHNDFYVECPSCGVMVEILALNCAIFRCGVFRDSGQQLPPHASREMCESAVPKIWGCGKPFRVVNNKAELCDFI